MARGEIERDPVPDAAGDLAALEERLLRAFAQFPDEAGAILLEEGVMPSDFRSSLQTRALYEAMIDLYNESRPVHRATLSEALKGARSGGRTRVKVSEAMIAELFEPAPGPPPDVRALCRALKDAVVVAEGRDLLSRGITQLSEGTGSPLVELQKVAKGLTDLVEVRSEGRGDILPALTLLESSGIEPTTGRKRRYPGLDSGFPILNNRLDGLENELYAFGAAAGMGKTTFATQLAYQLLLLNLDARVLYFSFDHSSRDVLVKFVSEAGSVPVKYVRHPLPKNEVLEIARQNGIAEIRKLAPRLSIEDGTRRDIKLAELEAIVAQARLSNPGPLVVVVDTLEDLIPWSLDGTRHVEEGLKEVARWLKKIARRDQAAIVGTFRLLGTAETRRPRREDVARRPGMLYEPHVVGTLYCDHLLNYETPLIEWEWGTTDMMVPIVELDILKHKMDGFRGRLFYRYLDSVAAYRECAEAEIDNYNAMIQNLAAHQKQKNVKAAAAPTPNPGERVDV